MNAIEYEKENRLLKKRNRIQRRRDARKSYYFTRKLDLLQRSTVSNLAVLRGELSSKLDTDIRELQAKIEAKAWPEVARPAFRKGIFLGIIIGVWLTTATIGVVFHYFM